MGIYYRTIFYKDVRNKDDFVIVAEMNSILENVDKERGYVIKEELLRFFGNKITSEDIGEHSRLEEQMGSSYGPGYDVQTSLPIR